MKYGKIIFTVIGISILSGCASTAGNYRPIVDGPKDAQYESDLGACKLLAEERSYTNGDVQSEAALVGVLGAITGAIDHGSKGALGGAIAGSIIGGGGRAWQTRTERKHIVVKCMQMRGHRVVG